jgi:hypothetical protein
MTKLLQIGIIFPHETSSGIGHVACTLGGVNYESRGGRGCVKGSAARGATHPLFRHHYHRVLSDPQAAAAKAWSDKAVGLPYKWGLVPKAAPPPKTGGDCSGYISGLISAAEGKPIVRRFSTGTWRREFRRLGFGEGLGGAGDDRPYPGTPIGPGSRKRNHVRWIQARLNHDAGHRHPVLNGAGLQVDGDYGPKTEQVVRAFQRVHGLRGLGMCGPRTWPLLNAIR